MGKIRSATVAQRWRIGIATEAHRRQHVSYPHLYILCIYPVILKTLYKMVVNCLQLLT